MADLQSGETYVDGQTVDASRLNNMINGADALPGLISGQASATPAGADEVLLLKGGVLKRATVTALNVAGSGVTSVAMTVPTGFAVGGSPVTTTGTLAVTLSSQTGNKVLRSAAAGGAATPAFRATDARDLYVASVNIAASNIDWSLGTKFWKSLSGNITFTFSNNEDGMGIKVAVFTNGHTTNWPAAVVWPGGTEPTDSVSGTDLYELDILNGVVHAFLINQPNTGAFQ
jgi:hypothetical protein